jgi:hypothetical protein
VRSELLNQIQSRYVLHVFADRGQKLDDAPRARRLGAKPRRVVGVTRRYGVVDFGTYVPDVILTTECVRQAETCGRAKLNSLLAGVRNLFAVTWLRGLDMQGDGLSPRAYACEPGVGLLPAYADCDSGRLGSVVWGGRLQTEATLRAMAQ